MGSFIFREDLSLLGNAIRFFWILVPMISNTGNSMSWSVTLFICPFDTTSKIKYLWIPTFPEWFRLESYYIIDSLLKRRDYWQEARIFLFPIYRAFHYARKRRLLTLFIFVTPKSMRSIRVNGIKISIKYYDRRDFRSLPSDVHIREIQLSLHFDLEGISQLKQRPKLEYLESRNFHWIDRWGSARNWGNLRLFPCFPP